MCPQNIHTGNFYINWSFSKYPKSHQSFWATFVSEFVAKNFKKSPIWSHWSWLCLYRASCQVQPWGWNELLEERKQRLLWLWILLDRLLLRLVCTSVLHLAGSYLLDHSFWLVGTAIKIVFLPPQIPWIGQGGGILLLRLSMICVIGH